MDVSNIPRLDRRLVLAIAGAGCIAVGLLTLQSPDLMRGPLGANFEPLTTSEFLPVIVATALILIGVVRSAQQRLTPTSEDRQLESALNRAPSETALPGQSFDRTLDTTLHHLDRAGRLETDEVQRHLRTVAEDVLVSFTEADRQTAGSALDAGTWTEDPVAAAFLSAANGPQYSPLQRLYAWVFPRQATERRVERTVNALQRIVEPSGRTTSVNRPPFPD